MESENRQALTIAEVRRIDALKEQDVEDRIAERKRKAELAEIEIEERRKKLEFQKEEIDMRKDSNELLRSMMEFMNKALERK